MSRRRFNSSYINELAVKLTAISDRVWAKLLYRLQGFLIIHPRHLIDTITASLSIAPDYSFTIHYAGCNESLSITHVGKRA